MAGLRDKAEEEGYKGLVVYADREHSANLAFLTGYDPRFEEALLVIDLGGGNKPALMVGHEGWGYLGISPIAGELKTVLFPSFSLMGQDRIGSRRLVGVLRSAGLEEGMSVGVAGWKYYTREEADAPETMLEVPSYIADALRAVCGSRELVRNANDLLMDPERGLRTQNGVDQLACFEFAASHTSQAVRDAVFGLRPGMTEFDAVRLMRLSGLPLSCHLMLSSGPRAFMGLGSPSSRRIERGDPFTTAYGVWGALNCRAGFVVEGEDDLPEGIRDYVERLVAPYFEAVAAWYEHVGIGVTGGEIYSAVHDRIGDPFFGVSLNPGHIISLDEWVHSPIYESSTIRLRSGMAIQMDIIPATGTHYFTINAEDGIALADEGLRAELAERYPEAWRRIKARREFMMDVLGIRLRPEVLPFSNMPGYLPPYLLNPYKAMRMVGD
ncbi:MAG: M24 family metallopeptidase [Candidatus Bathyarchaeota archaeon]|nr:MAG: M24 family metallopeptidase [Candidatus Bathyarchaeota archaeon]